MDSFPSKCLCLCRKMWKKLYYSLLHKVNHYLNLVEIGKVKRTSFVTFSGDEFLRWVKGSGLYCSLKMCNTFCMKKIIKTRYHLSHRWMERRPRKKNKWLGDLTLPREWKIKCKTPNPALLFHLHFGKIQVSIVILKIDLGAVKTKSPRQQCRCESKKFLVSLQI